MRTRVATACARVATTCARVAIKSINNLNELVTEVNNELIKIATWFCCNKMAINSSKTKFIIFKTKEKRIDKDDVTIVFNDNEPNTIENPDLCHPLKTVYHNNPTLSDRSYKLLGAHLD
jgi:hypothetical protein